VLSREQGVYGLPIQVGPHQPGLCPQASAGQRLHLVVESQGRVCFGPDLADSKGILGNVTLGARYLLPTAAITMPGS
jgi:hypothetical protein